jgi:multisubunit Na+/H+ antiporter MnhF subunit
MWIGTTVVAQNITGGYLAWIMVTYSFIADNSEHRDRVFRLGLINFCYVVR